MKANFALSLSFDGIRLLHRAAGGWRRVGEVPLDHPDLPGALARLRADAIALEPEGLRTKLIIPGGQIKYLTIETPGADTASRRAAAEAALDGATPYPVVDLAYDTSPDGDLTHVAAVARETLAEAEAFAVDHQFNPISTVAIPDEEPFLGEPFFGPTAHAETLLAPEDKVQPDWIAVVELSGLPQPEEPVADIEAPAIDVDDDTADVEETLTAEAVPDVESEIEVLTPTVLKDAKEASPPAAASDSPGFASRRSGATAAAPILGGVTRETGRFSPGDTPPAPKADVLSASLPGAETQSDDVAAAAFTPPVTPEAHEGTLSLSKQPLDDFGSDIPPQRVPRPDTESQRMTVFGARKPAAEAVVGGKPRFLGLILTAMLLLFLAGVAAWATVFRSDGISEFFSPRAPEQPVLAEELQPEPEPQEVEPEIRTASLSVEPLPQPPALDVPAAPEAFDPDQAREYYAITGIWAIPPEVPQPPALLSLDNLYVTSIDPANLSFDAVALAPASEFDVDKAFRAPGVPAPPGTRFSLDSRGLVIPTPDGAVSPDGALVFLGRPPAVPPPRPDAPVESTPEPDTEQIELAAIRPKPRPDGLAERTERQQLGGLSRDELAEMRPRARPKSAQQVAEEAAEEAEPDAPPTAQAAVESKRPRDRPANFARLVARAKPAPEADDAQESPERKVASVAPRAVTPKIPSSASVTRQATVKNAINLNRINLMGVYGTPSNRRALIRLANGRYKKVQVGDRIDGGRVSAIGDAELRYEKGSRNIVLKMPKT